MPNASTRSPLSRLLRERADVGVLGVALVITLLFPKRDIGLYGLGSVTGALYALNAIGVVLVYRSNRILNFAQVSFGLVGGVLFASLVTYDPILRVARDSVCESCFTPTPTWWPDVNFWLAAALAVATATVLSWLAYVLVIRRLNDSPRLVVTLATLFVAPICDYLTNKIGDGKTFASQAQQDARIQIGAPQPPFSTTLKIGLVTLHAGDLLVIVAVVVLLPLLVLYLGRSSTGIAIRAAAENPGRVATLGVNVRSVIGKVWLLAGFLSGVAGVLQAMSGGGGRNTDGVNVGLLVRIFAVAVIARLTSLTIAAVAAVVLGILQECVLFAFGTPLPLDGSLLILISVVLLLQRRVATRADSDTGGQRTAREVRPIPAELRNLPEVVKWVRGVAVVITVLVGVAPLLLSPSQIDLAAYVLIATMLFLSLLVLTGWAGQISLGQMAFAAVGAYVTATSHLPFVLALLLGAVAGGVLAALVGIPGLKLRGLHLAIITLALSLSVSTYLLNKRYLGSSLPESINRPSLLGMNFDNGQVFYYAMLVLLVLVALMVTGLRRSPVARALIASRDNESAAQGFGVNLLRVRLVAFAISGGISGFAGGLLAYQQHAVIPETFSARVSLTIFLFSALGGLGAVASPLVAGGLFAVAELFLSSQGVRLATGLGGLLVLIASAGGVSELLFSVRDNLLRGVARRRKILVPSLLADERDLGAVRARLPIAPKRQGRHGGNAYVPSRYRLEAQYGLVPPVDAMAGEP